MKRFEYIAIVIDLGDLSALNRYGGEGWHVVSTFVLMQQGLAGIQMEIRVLLEREIPEHIQ